MQDGASRREELIARMLRERGLPVSSRGAIAPRPDRGRAPATPVQEGLWFLDQLDPGSSQYNVPGAMHIAGPLRPELLERAIGAIMARHDVLRTTFELVDGHATQIIGEVRDFSLEIVDLSHLPAKERQAEAHRLATEDAGRSFDLEHGPVYRNCLLRLGDLEHVFLASMHHIVTDGWSMGVLAREIKALYESYVEEGPDPLRAMPLQFGDYAVWQAERMESREYRRQVEYWMEALGGPLPVLRLATDRPRPAVATARGAHFNFVMPAPLTSSLRSLAREERATTYETLLAVYAVLLHIRSGQEDVIVGGSSANRNRKELEGLIGYFVNMLPLRVAVRAGMSFRGILAGVRETSRNANAHQEVPFGKLVEALNPPRDPAFTPVFQVAFSFLDPADTPPVFGYGFRCPVEHRLNIADLVATPFEVESGVSKFDMTLLLWDMEREIGGTIEYNSDLFDRGTMEAFAGAFTRIAGKVCEDRNLDVGALRELCDEGEIRDRDEKRRSNKKSIQGKLVKARRKAMPTGSGEQP